MPFPHFARRAAISWARSRDLTPQRVWPVLRDLGGLEGLLAAPEDELSDRLASRERARSVLAGPSDAAAERWAASVEASGIRVVTAFDEEYPKALSEIADPPSSSMPSGASRSSNSRPSRSWDRGTGRATGGTSPRGWRASSRWPA